MAQSWQLSTQLNCKNFDVSSYLKHGKAEQAKLEEALRSADIINISIDPICMKENCGAKLNENLMINFLNALNVIEQCS